MNITRMAIWKIEQRYKLWGKDGLKDHKPGRLFEPLSSKFYTLVIQEWKKNKCGARKLHMILTRKGFGVSKRKISQVLVTEGFQKRFPKRSKPRKYKSYEWPIPSYMWHTDWHRMKRGKYKGQYFISYLDDCTRKIMSFGLFESPTSRNSLLIIYKAIADHGVAPYELNSDRGSQFIPNKYDKRGKANSIFQNALCEIGILFIPSRARHPQTNGKIEKFHDILEKEFDERFDTMEQFIQWYNAERLSEALDYKTPNEAYQNRL